MHTREYQKEYRKNHLELSRARDRAYYQKNIEAQRKRKREYWQTHPELSKTSHQKYYQENKEMLKQQNKEYKAEHREHYTKLGKLSRERKFEALAGRPRPVVCEVCGDPNRIVYDHDHKTGKFRGWICHNCNLVLGHARDDIKVMYKLIAYLKKNI